MNNYEYIIASLPALASNWRGELDTDGITQEIRSQLSDKDKALFDFVADGFDSDKLGSDFYRKALASRDNFIAKYFSYDLDVRNCRVEYLNRELGRAQGQDVLVLGEEERDFEDRNKVMAVLEGNDILARERGLDEIMWEKIERIVELEVFSLDVILAFECKMRIVSRWLRLDPESGRQLFRRLVEELQSSKKPL